MRPQRQSTDLQNLPFFSDAPEIPLKTVQLGAVKRPRTKNLINPAYARESSENFHRPSGVRKRHRSDPGARTWICISCAFSLTLRIFYRNEASPEAYKGSDRKNALIQLMR